MLSIAEERSHLLKAEQDVTEGERRIAEQTNLIERLKRHGHETEQAKELLVTLKETLQTWCAHRDEIRRTLAQLEDQQLSTPAEQQ